jgi:hypothetical protein
MSGNRSLSATRQIVVATPVTASAANTESPVDVRRRTIVTFWRARNPCSAIFDPVHLGKA